jgi:hypothetical protein
MMIKEVRNYGQTKRKWHYENRFNTNAVIYEVHA